MWGRTQSSFFAYITIDGGLWHCTGGSDQDYLQEKEMQKGKMVVWGGHTNSMKSREAKGKRKKERYTHLNAEFQKTARREKKAFLSDECKEIDENNRMERLEISSRKLAISRKHFMWGWSW